MIGEGPIRSFGIASVLGAFATPVVLLAVFCLVGLVICLIVTLIRLIVL